MSVPPTDGDINLDIQAFQGRALELAGLHHDQDRAARFHRRRHVALLVIEGVRQTQLPVEIDASIRAVLAVHGAGEFEARPIPNRDHNLQPVQVDRRQDVGLHVDTDIAPLGQAGLDVAGGCGERSRQLASGMAAQHALCQLTVQEDARYRKRALPSSELCREGHALERRGTIGVQRHIQDEGATVRFHGDGVHRRRSGRWDGRQQSQRRDRQGQQG